MRLSILLFLSCSYLGALAVQSFPRLNAFYLGDDGAAPPPPALQVQTLRNAVSPVLLDCLASVGISADQIMMRTVPQVAQLLQAIDRRFSGSLTAAVVMSCDSTLRPGWWDSWGELAATLLSYVGGALECGTTAFAHTHMPSAVAGGIVTAGKVAGLTGAAITIGATAQAVVPAALAAGAVGASAAVLAVNLPPLVTRITRGYLQGAQVIALQGSGSSWNMLAISLPETQISQGSLDLLLPMIYAVAVAGSALCLAPLRVIPAGMHPRLTRATPSQAASPKKRTKRARTKHNDWMTSARKLLGGPLRQTSGHQLRQMLRTKLHELLQEGGLPHLPSSLAAACVQQARAHGNDPLLMQRVHDFVRCLLYRRLTVGSSAAPLAHQACDELGITAEGVETRAAQSEVERWADFEVDARMSIARVPPGRKQMVVSSELGVLFALQGADTSGVAMPTSPAQGSARSPSSSSSPATPGTSHRGTSSSHGPSPSPIKRCRHDESQSPFR